MIAAELEKDRIAENLRENLYDTNTFLSIAFFSVI